MCVTISKVDAIDYKRKYDLILQIKSYAEFILKCTIFNIKIPKRLTEEKFNWYLYDDYRWEVFTYSIASSHDLPF